MSPLNSRSQFKTAARTAGLAAMRVPRARAQTRTAQAMLRAVRLPPERLRRFAQPKGSASIRVRSLRYWEEKSNSRALASARTFSNSRRLASIRASRSHWSKLRMEKSLLSQSLLQHGPAPHDSGGHRGLPDAQASGDLPVAQLLHQFQLQHPAVAPRLYIISIRTLIKKRCR